MGMDVFGKKPNSEVGKYFRNNVWWWHGIPQYIEHAHPDLYAKCKHWHTNDGDGLNAEDACELARRIFADRDSGKLAEFAATFESERGRASNYSSHYHFDADNVVAFACFAAASGGFEIC